MGFIAEQDGIKYLLIPGELIDDSLWGTRIIKQHDGTIVRYGKPIKLLDAAVLGYSTPEDVLQMVEQTKTYLANKDTVR